MTSKNTAKKSLIIFSLCVLTMGILPLILLLSEISFMPAGAKNFLQIFAAVFVGGNIMSLYALPHAVNALILRSAVKTAKEEPKKAWFLPVIPLVFAAAACIFYGIFPVTENTSSSVVYYVILALFYLLAVLPECFSQKLRWSKTADKYVFMLLVFALFFVGAPCIMYVLEGGSRDPFGIGANIVPFVCFVFIGVYMAFQEENLLFLPAIGGVFFVLFMLIVVNRSNGFHFPTEALPLAIVYIAVSYIILSIIAITRKAIEVIKNLR